VTERNRERLSTLLWFVCAAGVAGLAQVLALIMVLAAMLAS